jgi:RimJ/RimL family protein N-acetyltransferase
VKFPLSLEPVLRQLDRVVSCDITRVYRLPLECRRQPPPGAGAWDFRFLDADALARWANRADLELGERQLADIRSGETRCFAATRGTELGGYAWFAEHSVAPRYNTGGPRFTGIGLTLAPGIAYAFKCFVPPGFRGNALMSRLLHESAATLENEGCRELVTTTDIGNRSFQRSVERIGFRHVDHAAEFVLLGRHFFLLPRRDGLLRFHAGRVS